MTGEDTRIRVELPLPLDVAATITKLIGVAYPTAQMEGQGRTLTFVIPAGARAKAVSKRAGKAEPAEGGELREWDKNGLTISTPHELAAFCLSIMEASFNDFPDAKNYLEQQVHNPTTGKKYVMTFQRYEGYSPDELKRQAEAKLAAAEAKLAEWKAAEEQA